MTNQCNYPTGLLPARGRFCLVFVRSTSRTYLSRRNYDSRWGGNW